MAREPPSGRYTATISTRCSTSRCLLLDSLYTQLYYSLVCYMHVRMIYWVFNSQFAPIRKISEFAGFAPHFAMGKRRRRNFDMWSPATWLPLPAPPDPSPNSQIHTNSQSSVILALAPPFANPIFANLPTQIIYVYLMFLLGEAQVLHAV